MSWRRLLWLSVLVAGGCWSNDANVEGAFTPAQWHALKSEFTLPDPVDPCVLAGFTPGHCGSALTLGAALFSDPQLSFTKQTSCATCHSKDLIDQRQPDALSQCDPAPAPTNTCGTGWTGRNSMTLFDLGRKVAIEKQNGLAGVFTWSGGNGKVPERHGKTYTMPGDVAALAITRPMNGSETQTANLIRTNGNYYMLYGAAFGHAPTSDSDHQVFVNVEQVFDAYLMSFESAPAPFDHWIAGDETAISDSAKRGFAVFVGRGTCESCHKGYLFSSLEPIDTGVPQRGDSHVPANDSGRAGVTGDPADTGKFIVGTLRNIALTKPYMHDGTFATLGEVIDFYRGGGVADDWSGVRDGRIQPLDLSDQDAEDLEAFLNTLTSCDNTSCPDGGTGSGSGMPPPPDAGFCTAMDGNPGTVCNGTCTDVQFDPSNCGTCGHACMTGTYCVMGGCGPSPCPPPMPLYCPMSPVACVDPAIDPMNCGACGHLCAPGQTCYQGNCQ